MFSVSNLGEKMGINYPDFKKMCGINEGEDIMIQMLKWARVKLSKGKKTSELSFKQGYTKFIKNENKHLNDEFMKKLYEDVIYENSNGSFMKMEAYTTLLNHEALQEARAASLQAQNDTKKAQNSSRNAFLVAISSFGISIVMLIITLFQIDSPTTLSKDTTEKIETLINDSVKKIDSSINKNVEKINNRMNETKDIITKDLNSLEVQIKKPVKKTGINKN